LLAGVQKMLRINRLSADHHRIVELWFGRAAAGAEAANRHALRNLVAFADQSGRSGSSGVATVDLNHLAVTARRPGSGDAALSGRSQVHYAAAGAAD